MHSSRPLRSRHKDTKTQRQAWNDIRLSSLPPWRLCVRPFRLNHRRMAAKITRGRKRRQFPSDETVHREHSPGRQTHTFALSPSRGPRRGGPADDGPTRERWVPPPQWNSSPRRGDRSPPPANTSNRSRHRSSTTPRNTKRIGRKSSKPPRGPSSPIWNPPASTGFRSALSYFTSAFFACPPPARNSFSHRAAEVGTPFIRALLGGLSVST